MLAYQFVVVQATAGAKVSVSGHVTARAGGTFVRRFGRELPQPLDFSAAI